MKPAVAGVLALAACATAPSGDTPPDVDLSPVWRAMDHGDLQAALDAAEAVGWERARSVEGERARQDLLVRQGRRSEAAASAARWRSAEAGARSPELAYLEARLLQRPERLWSRLEELARRWPRHPWIRLALAAQAQQVGQWEDARRHLEAAADRGDARAFRNLVLARQLARERRAGEALELLEPAAFAGGERDALLEYYRIAAGAGRADAARRAAAELELRALRADAPARLRMESVAARLAAELRWRPGSSLEELLEALDDLCRRGGAPGGWLSHPRHGVAPVGELVRPEVASGGPAAAWAAEGLLPLLGSAIVHGTDFLLLKDARRCAIPWPGEAEPVEAVLAESAVGARPNDLPGGALFRGFYVRLDLVRRSAEALAGEAAAARLPDPFRLPPGAAEDGPWIPEDWDLPLRLRARCLAEPGADAARLELQHVFFHEAGHLPEVLDLVGTGARGASNLWAFLASLVRYGHPLRWLEERAEARALAAAPDPRWVLAEVVQRSRSPGDPYRRPYEKLLRSLVLEARARGLPELPLWHELDAGALRGLGAAACRRGGFEPLDESVAAGVSAAFEALADPAAAPLSR